jgi:protein SCO1
MQDGDVSRVRRRSLPTLVLALLGVALAVAGCGGSSAPPAPSSGVGTVLDRAVPPAIGSLPLKTGSGRTVTLDSLRGRTVVISDSMTLCSEDCPLDTANVTAAARATDAAGLGGKVEFLTVTVDPARDDRRHLTAYRRLYDPAHALPNWALLTGSPATLTRLWHYFGVYWEKVPEDSPPDHDWLTGRPLTYDIQHADDVLVLDPDGHERYVISGHANVPGSGRLPAQMRTFLSAAGRRHLLRPGADTWTPGDVVHAVSWLTGHRIDVP